MSTGDWELSNGVHHMHLYRTFLLYHSTITVISSDLRSLSFTLFFFLYYISFFLFRCFYFVHFKLLYYVILCCSIIFAFELHIHTAFGCFFFIFLPPSFCSTSIKFKRKFNSQPAECAHIYALDKRNGVRVCVFFHFFFRGKQEPVNVQL